MFSFLSISFLFSSSILSTILSLLLHHVNSRLQCPNFLRKQCFSYVRCIQYYDMHFISNSASPPPPLRAVRTLSYHNFSIVNARACVYIHIALALNQFYFPIHLFFFFLDFSFFCLSPLFTSYKISSIH